MAGDDELPTLDKCDLSDPEERFLWMYLALPDIIGAPLAFPVAWFRKVSAHQVKCGAMIECPECGHREPQQIKYRLDPTEDPAMGAGGRWVSFDDPEPEHDEIARRLAKMGPHIKRQVFEHLREEFQDDPTLRDGGSS